MSRSKEIEIPVIPGDGVGPELVEAAISCLEALGGLTGTVFSFPRYAAGYAAYSEKGTTLPEETLAGMRKRPATLMGAISSKDCPRPSPMGQMRKALEFYADIRPCVSLPGSPRPGVDILIVRECSEGFLPDRNMYSGVGEFMPTPDVAMSVRVITREKSAQIARMAYELAKKQGRRKVTIAHKAVVFSLGCGLFREAVLNEAARYPEIETTEEHVDVLAGHLVTEPEKYDVIVTTNLFGDILSEVAAAQVGSLVPIINVGRETALFYPGHGPLKQLTGRGKANPTGILSAAALLLHWLGLGEEGKRLDRALARCVSSDMGGALELPDGVSTGDVVGKVIESL